jgi:DNA-binding transcriptional regulator YiaG
MLLACNISGIAKSSLKFPPPSSLGRKFCMIKELLCAILQKYVALLLNVSEDCITYWKNGKSVPQIHHHPRIIDYPFSHETESFAGKLLQIRHCKGFSRKQCAAHLSVSDDAVRRWERGKPIANVTYQRLIHSVWNELPLYQLQHPF